MDQVKIGNFLKELRKEKALTQEELADKFNSSMQDLANLALLIWKLVK